MTVANNIISLALRNSGVCGVGQSPAAEDTNDALTILNDLILTWQLQRTVQVIPGVLATFPGLFVDVPSWTANENILLVCLTARLMQAYALPPDPLLVKAAETAVQLLQSNAQQWQPPVVAGLPTTALGLIFLALRMAGRITDAQGVAAGSKDVGDAFSLLVMMLAQWQRRRWLVWSLAETALVSTGATTYSVGPAGDFAIPRPDKIDAAFVRLLTSGPNYVDFGLSIIEAREDWSQIGLKSLTTFPAAVFYDSAWPIGILHVWPVPSAALYEIHIVTKAPLPVLATPADTVSLPPEYQEAVVSNLACRIAGASGTPPNPYVLMLAKSALNTVRMANVQVAQLGMPAGLGHHGGSGRAASADPAFQSGGW